MRKSSKLLPEALIIGSGAAAQGQVRNCTGASLMNKLCISQLHDDLVMLACQRLKLLLAQRKEQPWVCMVTLVWNVAGGSAEVECINEGSLEIDMLRSAPSIKEQAAQRVVLGSIKASHVKVKTSGTQISMPACTHIGTALQEHKSSC